MRSSILRNSFLYLGVFLSICCGLLACTPFPAKQLDRSSIQNVRVLGLAGPSEPRYAVMSFGSGPLFNNPNSAAESVRREEFNLLMADQKLHLGQELQHALVKELQQRGYQIEITSIRQDKPGILNADDLRRQRAEVILFTDFNNVFYANGLTDDTYSPAVMLEARLIDPQTGNILFQKFYGYGPTYTSDRDIVDLPSSSEFRFSSYEELKNQPSRAAKGFLALVPTVSASIANAIAK
ncbi:MAG: hypothetical protein K8R18_07065 [Parvibaculum sp.]|uniref:hypothetical protein n=1 Tax=Parvibaculum sp. TaxID=2024848 RepID=UPI0025CF204B|nr:hypothetical protein [Parvibaculum sp.]MCE9649369.1 hypothetical protein [Parvibaculum sp.]